MPVVTSGATTVGAVQISGLAPSGTPIESWPNAMLTGKAFAAYLGSAAVAAQYSYVELRNPTGSGKNCWVYLANGLTTTSQALYWSIQAPPLGAGTGTGLSLLTGVAGGVGRLTASSNVALVQPQIAQYFSVNSASGGQPLPWVMVLAPNVGLVIQCNTVNTIMWVNFAWAEV